MYVHRHSEKMTPNKEGKAEKASRILRNINLAVGAVASGAAGILAPPAAAVAVAYGGINVAQGGGFELLRRHAKRRRLRQDT